MLSKIFHRLCRNKNTNKESLNSMKQHSREVKEEMVSYNRNGDYIDGYDALKRGIRVSGKNDKEVAVILWPPRHDAKDVEKAINTAKSRLSNMLSGLEKPTLDKILAIMEASRPDDFIYFLCDYFNFTRPARKSQDDILKEVQDEIKTTASALELLIKKVSLLSNKK